MPPEMRVEKNVQVFGGVVTRKLGFQQCDDALPVLLVVRRVNFRIKCKNVWVWKNATCDAVSAF